MIKRIKISEVSDKIENKILCFFHYRYQESINIVFTEKELLGIIQNVKPRLLHFALETLKDTPFITIEEVDEEDDFVDGFSISIEGIKYVDTWEDDFYEETSEGINFLQNKEGEEETSQTSAPASDRIVLLTHNSEHDEAIKTLDEVIQEFKKDHKQDNEHGPEKKALLAILESGRDLLNDTKIKVDIATTTLVEPLQIIISRYDRELVATLATAALGAILKLLGLS